MRSLLILPLMASLVLGGCASTSELTTRYLAAPAEITGPRLLLAGRSPEPHVRDEWEKSCAEILRDAGFRVTRSARSLPRWFEPGSADLTEWAGEHNTDLILIAELTRLLPAPMMAPPTQEQRRTPGMHDNEGTLSIPLGESLRDRPRDTPELQQNIEIMLLDGSGLPIWAADIQTDEANEIRAVARSQCREMRRVMRELGLTPE